MAEIEPSLIADLLRQSMDSGSTPYLNVISDSMAPLFIGGDQVQLSPISLEALQTGDVVVVHGSNELITHRFWGVFSRDNQVHLVTKGDRPQHFDQPHDADTLVGLVTARKRNKRIMNIGHGIGRWLNRWLALLASVDIRLFSHAVSDEIDDNPTLYSKEGRFATSTRDSRGHLIGRRSLYILAKLPTIIVQQFDQLIKDS